MDYRSYSLRSLIILSSLCILALASPGWAQNVILTNGDDVYTNTEAIDNLLGRAGDDILTNENTINTSLLGGPGNDTITNNGLARIINGGLGNDTITNNMIAYAIIGAYGNNVITNNGLALLIAGGPGNDTIINNGLNLLTFGGDGNDLITNNMLALLMAGGSGNDTLTNNGLSLLTYGGFGDDIITNNGRALLLAGGPGNDTITNNGDAFYMGGGRGNDILTNSETGRIYVMLGRDGDDVITNAGLVYLDIDGENGNDTLINSGTVQGSLLGGLGGDTVRILPGSVVYGQVDGGYGWDLLSLEAAGTFNAIQYVNFEDLTLLPDGTAYLVGDWLFPDGTVRVQSGSVVIPNLLTARNLTIDAGGKLHVDGIAWADQSTNYGRLWVNGELNSPLTNFGFLGGEGTIFGDVANSGVIAPGNSIGSLNIEGNYRHGANAEYEAELAANGTSDRIVISGRATLEGGTVTARLPRRLYTDSFGWTVLTAQNGIRGRFGSVSQPDSAVLSLDLAYNARSVELEIQRTSYGAFGGNANQQSLGTALDVLVPLAATAGNDMEAFLTVLDFDYDADQLLSLLAALNPEPYTHVVAAQGNSIQRFGQRLTGRTAQISAPVEEASPLWSLWGYAYADRTDREATAEYLGHSTQRLGGMLGADRKIFDNTAIGFALATETTDIDSSRAGASGDQDGFMAGLYTRTAMDRFFAEAFLAYGCYDNAMTRRINFDGYNALAGGGFDGAAGLAQISGGYDFTAGTWTFGPLVTLSYLHTSTDAFQESGNSFLNLNVEGTRDDRLIGALGAMAKSEVKWGALTLRPQLSLTWLHDLEGETTSMNATFNQNSQNSFGVTGSTYSEDSLSAETRLAASWDSRWSAYGALAGNWGRDWNACGLAAGMTWRF